MSVSAQFRNVAGEISGPLLSLPIATSRYELEVLLNTVLKNAEHLPYAFFVGGHEIQSAVADIECGEACLAIVYRPQCIFSVRPVTRCASTMGGHEKAVLSVCYSADGLMVASGSGDGTVRVWDVDTGTEIQRLRQTHASWVLAVAWSADGRLASGSRDGSVAAQDKILKGHTDAVMALVWEPFCGKKLCTASRDGTVRVWNTVSGTTLFAMTHTAPVSAIKWGSLLYSASRDRLVKVWSPDDGRLVRTLSGHGHRVNSLALSTDYVLRTGPFDFKTSRDKIESKEEGSRMRYQEHCALPGNDSERLASSSDDFTIILWNPLKSKDVVCRMTGHQNIVSCVVFSPSGALLASASFDKSVRVWDGYNGSLLHVFRSHVASVYQCVFSADERLLLSASKDTTCKVWNLKTKKLKVDLPGHHDEVYTVDWSPNGDSACSGSKDCNLKIWK